MHKQQCIVQLSPLTGAPCMLKWALADDEAMNLQNVCQARPYIQIQFSQRKSPEEENVWLEQVRPDSTF